MLLASFASRIFKRSLRLQRRLRAIINQTRNNMKILVDNGHGSNTAGKRSPDGKFREYAYTREIAKKLVEELKKKGYEADLVTPEEYDVPTT